MDANSFDSLARLIGRSGSRRAMRKALGSGAWGLAWARLGLEAATAQEATRHDGCVHVNRRCKKSGQCCSGICKGKKGRKRCDPAR